MSRQRDRLSAMDLLTLMESRPWKDGKTFTYRYHPIGGKPINLGQDRINAVRKVLDLQGNNKDYGTVKWVWEEFTDKEDPALVWAALAGSSKKDYRQAWTQVEKTFGKMRIGDITSTMVARYVYVERKSAGKRANTEKALLSNLFGYGMLLGVCEVNATLGVPSRLTESRTVCPARNVLKTYLEWLEKQTPQRRIIGMAAEFASLAGNRQIEFLPLSWQDIDREEEQIRLIRAKQRGKKKGKIVEVVSISPAMDALLTRLRGIFPDRDCHYVFPTQDGNQYSSRGFQTLWHRCVRAAMKLKIITPETRFTFHDLRAYYATKHKHDKGSLPDLHKNPQTTAQVYDRNEEVFRDAL